MVSRIKSSTRVLKLCESIAREAHAGQYRRNGVTPYIFHPEEVTSRCESFVGKCGAWLHDTIEDTFISESELLKRGVPQEIVDVVVLVTKREGQPYIEYLDQIKTNEYAVEVKVADMLSNLSDKPTTRQIRKYSKGLLQLTGP